MVPPPKIAALYWAGQAAADEQDIDEEEYHARCKKTTKASFFLNALPDPTVIAHFTNLTNLDVHLHNLNSPSALQHLTRLTSLALTECALTTMRGLPAAPALTRLDLSSNRIPRLEPAVLAGMPLLKTLFASENPIRRIEGLESLAHLETLHLARTEISHVGEALRANAELAELNLAACGVVDFKDIPAMARLGALVRLSFADPHYGAAPVCALCNYKTYVLFHLRSLEELDTLFVTAEGRALAEATFMKKKLFYNMRIKTLRRTAANVVRKAAEARASKLSQLSLSANVLLRQKKDIEHALFGRGVDTAGAAAAAARAGGGEWTQQLHDKLAVVDGCIAGKQQEQRDVDAKFAVVRSEVQEAAQASISRLLVELETGGNIRLEEGSPSDAWYTSCVDLVATRFSAADYEGLGVSSLRVHRVTRVYNRRLRNAFDEALEQLVDTTDPSYKRSLEYLLFGEHPRLRGELARVVEDGFRAVEEYVPSHGHAAVPLSNSVALADLPRLRADMKARAAEPLRAKLLISKVLLARCTAERPLQRESADSGGGGGGGARRDDDGGGGGARRDDGGGGRDDDDPPPVRQEDYPKHSSVYRQTDDERKQRSWFVFDPRLVLPEYVVEIEYVPLHAPPRHEPSPTQLLQLGGGEHSRGAEAADLANLTRPLVRFVQEDAVAAMTAAEPDDVFQAVLSMPPNLPPSTKMTQLTPDAVAEAAGGGGGLALADVVRINLHGRSLGRIACLEPCTKLQVLVLCFNEIMRIEGLESLVDLRRLELGFNLIKRLDGLPELRRLEALELNNNLLYRLDDVTSLDEKLPVLRTLNLAANAVCEVKGYRANMVCRLRGLTELDNVAVTPTEVEALSTGGTFDGAATDKLVRAHSWAHTRLYHSLCPDRNVQRPIAAAAPEQRRQQPSAPEADDGDWWHTVEELDLSHQQLRSMRGLRKLTQLRRASFAGNEIVRVEAVGAWPLLEELSLEDNRLSSMVELAGMSRLTKLDLGKNRIARVEGLGALPALRQLSLEDNELTTLDGVTEAAALMELYAGGNRLLNLRDIVAMRALSELVILDLAANPLCADTQYRLYTVYHLGSRLKVLDGVSLEPSELLAARQAYTGKLTADALAERIAILGKPPHLTKVLDISHSKLRVVDALRDANLVALEELNLDCNQISDLRSLPSIATLQTLRLNHNLIAVPAAPQAHPGGRALPPTLPADANPRPEPPPLASFARLLDLRLGHNQLTSIAALQLGAAVPGLRVLHLDSNDITRIDGLEGLAGLRELVVDRNRIRGLEPASLAGLHSLRVLKLEDNALRYLDHLGPLPQLVELHLGSNRVVELSELDKLDAVPRLEVICLANNAAARKQLYRPSLLRRLPSLRCIDTREVSQEERSQAELIFASNDSRVRQLLPPVGMDAQRLATGIKVPLKLTAMDFQSMSGAPSQLGGLHGTRIAGDGREWDFSRQTELLVSSAANAATRLGTHGGGNQSMVRFGQAVLGRVSGDAERRAAAAADPRGTKKPPRSVGF